MLTSKLFLATDFTVIHSLGIHLLRDHTYNSWWKKNKNQHRLSQNLFQKKELAAGNLPFSWKLFKSKYLWRKVLWEEKSSHFRRKLILFNFSWGERPKCFSFLFYRCLTSQTPSLGLPRPTWIGSVVWKKTAAWLQQCFHMMVVATAHKDLNNLKSPQEARDQCRRWTLNSWHCQSSSEAGKVSSPRGVLPPFWALLTSLPYIS